MAKNPTPANDDTPSPSPDAFDVKRIRQLVALMTDNGLTEIDLEWQESRIRLKRGFDGPVMVAAPTAAPPHAMMSAPAAAPSASAGASAATGGAPAASNLLEIKSPLVGTFYTQSSPDSPPFVKVGDRVTEDTVVCIVEAMKVFNEIPAKVRGVVKEVCVENGTPTEFDQVLFRVAPE